VWSEIPWDRASAPYTTDCTDIHTVYILQVPGQGDGGFEGGYVCIKIAQTFGAKMLEPAQFIYCNHRSL
jgi:hypothetical protein